MSSVQFKNAEELLSYFNENKDAIHKLLSASTFQPAPKPKVDQADALGNRDVVAEARSDQMAPAVTKDNLPLAPAPRLVPVVGSSKDGARARNSLRLVNGTSYIFHPLVQLGENYYVPDFRLNHRLIHRANQIVMANKRFYDSSEFFHPLVAHIYCGVLEIVQVMRVRRDVSRLSYQADFFLNWFEETFSYNALPVPGFLRNQLTCLAASSPAMSTYDNVAPALPPLPNASTLTRFVISIAPTTGTASQYSYRFPAIVPLLEQYSQYLAAANAQAMVDSPNFARSIFGTNITAAGTTPFDRPAIAAGMPESVAALLGSPGFETSAWLPLNVANTLFAYRTQAESLMPQFPTVVTGTGHIDWNTYMGMNFSHQWFIEFARIMSYYSQFFNDSCFLSDIPTKGHSAGQVTFHIRGVARARPAIRYPDQNAALVAIGRLANMAIPEADALDASVGMLNTGIDYDVGDAPRAGKFFETLPIRQETSLLRPENGYGQILTDFYRVTNPLPPTIF